MRIDVKIGSIQNLVQIQIEKIGGSLDSVTGVSAPTEPSPPAARNFATDLATQRPWPPRWFGMGSSAEPDLSERTDALLRDRQNGHGQ
jgi:hypothetical protein